MVTEQQTVTYGDAALEENFGSPQQYGVKTPVVSPELKAKVGKAILTVAAADGVLSEKEMTRFLSLAAQFGVPPEGLEEMRNFDAVNAELEDYFDDETRPMAKVILHDAIRVARADGFGPKERAAAEKGATLLGISTDALRAIEAITDLEETLNQARAKVLAP